MDNYTTGSGVFGMARGAWSIQSFPAPLVAIAAQRTRHAAAALESVGRSFS